LDNVRVVARARPLNPFEKERGDKNIIKLPGDGAVWVSYLYCFIECMANVVLVLVGGAGDLYNLRLSLKVIW